MAMKNHTVNAIVSLGWERNYLGWSHWEVRDNDGERIYFGSADEVAKYLGIET